MTALAINLTTTNEQNAPLPYIKNLSIDSPATSDSAHQLLGLNEIEGNKCATSSKQKSNNKEKLYQISSPEYSEHLLNRLQNFEMNPSVYPMENSSSDSSGDDSTLVERLSLDDDEEDEKLSCSPTSYDHQQPKTNSQPLENSTNQTFPTCQNTNDNSKPNSLVLSRSSTNNNNAGDVGSNNNHHHQHQNQHSHETNSRSRSSNSSSNGSSNGESKKEGNNGSSGGSSESDEDCQSPESVQFAQVEIIDGTLKEKYNTKYWVQRNVITIQVISSFVFESCTVYCNKEGMSEPHLMEKLSFVDSFSTLSSTKVKALNLSTSGEVYESQFRKRLPFTSGRPETQKPIWLSAEFSMNNQIIKQVISSKFFVCSRPQGLKGQKEVSPTGTRPSIMSSSMDGLTQNSSGMTLDSNNSSRASLNENRNSVDNMVGTENSHSQHSYNSNSTMKQKSIKHSLSNHLPQYSQNQFSSSSSNSTPTTESFPAPNYAKQHISFTNVSLSNDLPPVHLYSIHPNKGPLNGRQEVTLFGDFESVPVSPHCIRVIFGLQDSPCVKQVFKEKIVCDTPDRIVPGVVRVEVVTNTFPQLSSLGDVFYTYYRTEERNNESSDVSSENSHHRHANKHKNIYHPYQ